MLYFGPLACLSALLGRSNEGDFPQTRLLSSQAFEIIARLLKVGEVVEVKTDPRFAYGKLGRAPDVPSNAEIHYVMALMEIKPPFEYEKMSPLVRVQG